MNKKGIEMSWSMIGWIILGLIVLIVVLVLIAKGVAPGFKIFDILGD